MPPTARLAELTADLPRWRCDSDDDAEKLTDWTIAVLVELEKNNPFLQLSNDRWGADGPQPGTPEWFLANEKDAVLETLEDALKQFSCQGDVTLLKEFFPEHADRLLARPGPVGRPKKTAATERDERVQQAVIDVYVIRHDIWKVYFGIFKRAQNDKVIAERIAAKRWAVEGDITDLDVHRALKKQ